MKSFYSLILLGIVSLTFANEVALVKKAKGQSHIVRQSKEINIVVGTQLQEKDIIITESKSSVGLIFKDNTRISVGPNSKLEIEQYLFEPAENKEGFVTNLSKGSMECITGLISKVNPSAFKVKVKTATMGIRGTHFIINVNSGVY
ncbi:FecR family protein [Sulfurimonas sp.]|uniref:FecR family protein n=1 Tax=Sulfurimonas sp. TaxID=2022749 RepID=UPI0025E8095D|nr:FecR family protein [Sulfurimonas sp.]